MTPATDLEVAIIGAGFSGLGAAIRLRQRGKSDFLVFDKASGVGGTWWVNRYPGCACDVPSQLYSFSFAPNPDWTRRFAPRAEIQAYLERLVGCHGLDDHLRLNTEIVRVTWLDDKRRWLLEDHQANRWHAQVLVAALGGLSRPAWPNIPGLASFAGQVMHSQQWDDDVELAGRHVAVIGTGTSAVQLVPHVARRARSLALYQRTPNWILPRPDRAISERQRALYRRLPWLQKLTRFGIWAVSETLVPTFLWFRRLGAAHRLLAHWHRRRQVADPVLRERLRPDYDIGCKRVQFASDYYPVLSEPHVELVTEGIDRIEAGGIVDGRGRLRAADVLVLATGFKATEPVPRGLITGRDGLDLAACWQDGPSAYKGTTVSGFPNLFVLMGPNTGLGHTSVVMMIESQIRYFLGALDHMQREGVDAIEVDEIPQAEWNRRLQRRLRGSVWNSGGCRSWYLHPESGRNTTIWPGFTLGFRWRLRAFDADAYRRV